MGLNERRKIKELQDVTFPGRVKEIEEICGAPIPYEVDWESLADDPEALNCIDFASCHRLNMALRGICIDEMGKQAVRDGLKRVKLKNVKEPTGRTIALKGGVLEMHVVYSQGAGVAFSDREIQEVLEKGL